MDPFGFGGVSTGTGGERLMSLSVPPPPPVPITTAGDTPLNDYLRPVRIGAFAPFTLRTVQLTAGVPAMLGTGSPLRVGLLLSHDGPSTTVVHCGPSNGSGIHPVLWVPGETTVGGTLGDLLSLLGAEWWASSPADVTLYIAEFVRPM